MDAVHTLMVNICGTYINSNALIVEEEYQVHVSDKGSVFLQVNRVNEDGDKVILGRERFRCK